MDQDFGKYAMGAVVVVFLGVLIYRSEHPSTKFAADGTDNGWDYAVRKSQSSGQPTVVLFSARWCPACQSLHGDVLSRGDVQHELAGHFNFYTVDLTNPSPPVQAHARKLGVSAIPQLIRYDKHGDETDRTNYLDPEQMIAWLKAGE
jgi:thiol:disulfide interchange protein